MAMRALASWVFTSSLVHVVCNTVLKADDPNAENDLGLTCSGPNATCADSNSAPGMKKGQANVLLQSQSEMQRVHKANDCDPVCSDTSVCDLQSVNNGDSKCWELKGNKYISGGAQNKIFSGEAKNSDQHCVLACRKESGYLAVYNDESGNCWCYGTPVGGTVTADTKYKMYLLPHSCSTENSCGTTTSDPTCGDQCAEYDIKNTCCDTCDQSDDTRRRDGRRRGYFCQRRRS